MDGFNNKFIPLPIRNFNYGCFIWKDGSWQNRATLKFSVCTLLYLPGYLKNFTTVSVVKFPKLLASELCKMYVIVLTMVIVLSFLCWIETEVWLILKQGNCLNKYLEGIIEKPSRHICKLKWKSLLFFQKIVSKICFF